MCKYMFSVLFVFLAVGTVRAECPMDLDVDQLITCVNKEGAGVEFGTLDNMDPRSANAESVNPSEKVASPVGPSMDGPTTAPSSAPAFADQ